MKMSPLLRLEEELTAYECALDKMMTDGFTADESNTVLRLEGAIKALKIAVSIVEEK